MERERWPLFDLLNGYVYQGSSNLFTVVHLAPAVGLDSTYLIRTLVSRVSDSGQTVTPLARYRVYATREGGRWVLGNALPRVTRVASRNDRPNHIRVPANAHVRPSARRAKQQVCRLPGARVRPLSCARYLREDAGKMRALLPQQGMRVHRALDPLLSRNRTAGSLSRYAPRRTRTPSLLIRSQALYPVELWARWAVLDSN